MNELSWNSQLHLKDIVRCFFGPYNRKVEARVRIAQLLNSKGESRLARRLLTSLRKGGVYISHNAKIDPSVMFPHPTGIVIGYGVVIHSGVRIFQGTTIGGARIGDFQADNYPTIGSNSTVFAGVVIVGKVKVGENCVIGANSVVLNDIPDNSVVVGAPARIIHKVGFDR